MCYYNSKAAAWVEHQGSSSRVVFPDALSPILSFRGKMMRKSHTRRTLTPLCTEIKVGYACTSDSHSDGPHAAMWFGCEVYARLHDTSLKRFRVWKGWNEPLHCFQQKVFLLLKTLVMHVFSTLSSARDKAWHITQLPTPTNWTANYESSSMMAH